MVDQTEIVEAIAQLDEAAGGLDKKPNVADVEELIGKDITRHERDDAWASFKGEETPEPRSEPDPEPETPAEPEPAKEPDPEPVAESKPASAGNAPMVTNNTGNPLNLFGTFIPKKEARPVPDFEADKPLIVAWLKAKVISVE